MEVCKICKLLKQGIFGLINYLCLSVCLFVSLSFCFSVCRSVCLSFFERNFLNSGSGSVASECFNSHLMTKVWAMGLSILRVMLRHQFWCAPILMLPWLWSLLSRCYMAGSHNSFKRIFREIGKMQGMYVQKLYRHP